MTKQLGMSTFGLLVCIFAFLFVAVTTVKIIPAYVDYYMVKSSLKALNELPAKDFSSDVVLNKLTLKRKLMSQLDANGINMITEDNITVNHKEHNEYDVIVKYQAIQPLYYNVKLMFDFTAAQEVHIDQHS